MIFYFSFFGGWSIAHGNPRVTHALCCLWILCHVTSLSQPQCATLYISLNVKKRILIRFFDWNCESGAWIKLLFQITVSDCTMMSCPETDNMTWESSRVTWNMPYIVLFFVKKIILGLFCKCFISYCLSESISNLICAKWMINYYLSDKKVRKTHCYVLIKNKGIFLNWLRTNICFKYLCGFDRYVVGWGKATTHSLMKTTSWNRFRLLIHSRLSITVCTFPIAFTCHLISINSNPIILKFMTEVTFICMHDHGK